MRSTEKSVATPPADDVAVSSLCHRRHLHAGVEQFGTDGLGRNQGLALQSVLQQMPMSPSSSANLSYDKREEASES